MTVHLYTLCWNEADMLGFFFRHYDPWVDRYVVYDDGSTDGSIEILRAHPRVELRRFERAVPDSFVLSHTRLQDDVWKESRGRADWVVITAVDEHLMVPREPMRDYLRRCRAAGVTYIPALGYQMVSEEFPGAGERLCEICTRGAPHEEMSKLSIFDPDAMRETRFWPGRHGAYPIGRLRLPRHDDLLLLHYKYVGFERCLARQDAQRAGLGSADIGHDWGAQYRWRRDELRADWQRFDRCAVDLSAVDAQPWRAHRRPRWWRWWTRWPRWWQGHALRMLGRR